MRVLTVMGTRPEAIKLAPVIDELRRKQRQRLVESLVCVTGQHRQMLDQVLGLFDIRPDYDLDIMQQDQSPSAVAAAVLNGLEEVIRRARPDWVLVQGDTASVAAGALCAFYCGVKVGHVEAGLRTFDKWRPFPEEVNRKVVSAIADLHFAPTQRARQNLVAEGVPEHQIVVTGNTVVDALQTISRLPPPPEVRALLDRIRAESTRIILVTAHRRENLGLPLESVCLALKDIVEMNGGEVQVIYPVHLNPNVQRTVYSLLDGVPGIFLAPPVSYVSLVHLLKQSYLVLTDSGGIQEEAPGLGVPVLVLREVTERPEGVEAGVVRLVGTDRRRIVEEVARLLEDRDVYQRMSEAVNPYGDGKASERVVGALLGEPVEPFAPDWNPRASAAADQEL